MIWIWSHRPQFLHLSLFIVAYVLACGFAQLLAIVPGTGISIWPPSGLFMATLILASRRSWPWWVLGALLAELFANILWFHNPLPVAVLLNIGNALEAAAGAWLVNRACRQPVRLETLQDILALVVLGAGIAPLISATVGSATLAWFGMQSFAAAWPLWWIGDATGVLIVAPLALVVFQNWHGEAHLSATRWIEACVLGLIFLAVAALSLSGYLPFAYIIMPPLLWAAVRFEFKGAAVTLILLALITAAFTLSGASQFAGDPESQKHNQIMLQLFLAISAASALIVAAISRQHHLAVASLRERERELSQLVDMVPSHLWRLTPDGEPIFFNKRMVDFLGLDVTDMEKAGMSRLEAVISTVIHPDDAAKVKDTLSRCLATGAPFSMRYRLRRADSAYHWMSSRAEPMRDQNGSVIQWYGLCHDIDDQVHAEEALRERERELSLLVNMVPSNLWRLTPDGETTLANKHMADFLGLDLSDKRQMEAVFETAFHPDDVQSVSDSLTHSLKTGETFAMRYRMRRWDGAYRWMSGRAEPLRDQDGRVVQWFGLCHDIDDQMHAEQALRQSERRLQQMIDAVPVRIWSMTPKGGPIYFNKRYQDYFRTVLKDFDPLEEPRVEKFVQALIHSEDAATVLRTLQNCFETGIGSVMRFRWRETDNIYRWAECRIEPRRDEDGEIAQWYGVSTDIDDEVRAQEALRRASDKLARATQAASLAELSASIAHEVNQPLAAIVANSHACQRWLSAEPPNVDRAKVTAERITRDANAAADVVNRIRALFRSTPHARSPEDVNRLIGEVCRLIADEAAARNIRIRVNLAPDLPSIALDRVQVQQVIVNLIRNGIEAMDTMVNGAGVLQISTCRDGPDAIRVQVRDAGRGFTDAERVFEPFFTTKEHGMGMGLAICRSIVESHGGRLWAERNEPQGATFIFTLPAEVNMAL
ncbi:PAS domain-containing protein [Nordella sp. HKS 07]|uniref:MASE1 domain-containing protein n=1 Tax=Nordella sp. HKS 07 TaxID=2712222 RepID=UPI0013E18A85|nr:MASE1 domain-containing protein [Nordella sp. HKS 07]QIG50017.1 PAS domain-containing protein [Nordella sp. HKS 07]